MSQVTKHSNNIKYFNYLMAVIFLLSVLRFVELAMDLNLPILRYLFVVLGSYWVVFKLINLPEAFEKLYSGWSLVLVSICLIFVSYSFIIGSDEIFSRSGNFINLKAFIGNKILLFVFPLFLFLRPRPEFWSSYLKFAYRLLFILIPFLFLDLSYYMNREKSPEALIRACAGASGFLLLISPYFKTGRKYTVLFFFFVSLLFMLYHARRNMVLYFGSYFLFYCYFVLFSNLSSVIVSKFRAVLNTLYLLIIFGFVLFLSNPDFSLFFERAGTGFESRESVIEDFFTDIVPYGSDYFSGRGMYGAFYSTTLGQDDTSETGRGGGSRLLIENGYLQFILNFGFLFLVCFVGLSLSGFYLGFFKSKNLFVKACAVVLILNLLDMVGWGLPEISFRYFLVWCVFPYCFSRTFRNFSDIEIKSSIKF